MVVCLYLRQPLSHVKQCQTEPHHYDSIFEKSLNNKSLGLQLFAAHFYSHIFGLDGKIHETCAKLLNLCGFELSRLQLRFVFFIF